MPPIVAAKKKGNKKKPTIHKVRRTDEAIEHDTLSTPKTLADSIVYEASKHLGKPYNLGSKGPYAFDCSGFTSYVFKQLGFNLASNSRDQSQQGIKVSREHVHKGDLVFFTGRDSRGGVGHVGIVFDVNPEENSFRFIHASTSKGITIQRYPDQGYYSKRYRGLRRMVDVVSPAQPPIEDLNLTLAPPANEMTLENEDKNALDLSVSQEQKTYKVKSGDNLSTIAQKNNCTVEQLERWNRLRKGANLRVGQTLIVQPKEKKAEEYLQESIQKAEQEKYANANNVQIRVEEGETIYSISEKYHCTIKEIANWNKLKSNKLNVGQELVIRPHLANAPKDVIEHNDVVHTVARGENIYQISRRYGCQVKEVKEWNGLKDNLLQPGMKLTIKRADKLGVHTVLKGETLESLAIKYNCSVNNLLEWNHLTSGNIREGQILKVQADAISLYDTESSGKEPETKTATNIQETTKQPDAETIRAEEMANSIYYTVKSGDTFKKIAAKYHTTTTQLLYWNNLTSYRLIPGQQMKVGVKKQNKASEADQTDAEETTSRRRSVEERYPPNAIYHTVKGGDTFRKIASMHNITTNDILTWNDLRSYALTPGMQLIVGFKDEPITETPSETIYVVKSGDNLYSIGRRHNCSVKHLMEWNNLKNDKLQLGQKLIIKHKTK